MPGSITLTCAVCGTPFQVTPNRSKGPRLAKYCSYRCRNLVNSPKHGHNRPGQRSDTYQCWASMLQRCLNSGNRNYPNYGGRGIKVCQRWLAFGNFLADMGERPPGMSLDRYPDQNGNYEPGNCRWATPKEQMRNTRWNRMLTFDGRTQCVSAWVEETGLSRGRLLTLDQKGLALEHQNATGC